MPLQATSGAASYDASGGGAAAVPTYIEEVFSTYLYTGNGSTQTITNGIDLADEGGLVWVKSRTNAFADHALSDTENGTGKYLSSNSTAAQTTTGNNLTAFNADGFTVGSRTEFNQTSASIASWTFRKQPKFFDVVTFTGDGRSSGSATINHNLGATPAVIIIKQFNGTGSWQYGTTFGSSNWMSLFLNGTAAGTTTTYANNDWFAAQPTSTTFTVGFPYYGSGQQYVAYLFASNAGGFGLTGTDNVISCGSLVSTGGVVNVNLGYETQWLLIKNASNIDSWYMYDTMRGMSMTDDYFLKANSSNAESNFGASYVKPTATGFSFDSSAFGASGETYIYIAIRRGPMKVPTSGTSVFLPQTRTGTDSGTVTVSNIGFTPDLAIIQARGSNQGVFEDRLRGNFALFSPQTNAESNTGVEGASGQQGWAFNASTGYGNGNDNYVNYFLQRAPGYFDEVCYTGNSAQTAYNHNLGVAPELVIVKVRNVSGESWPVWCIYGTQQNSWATILDGTNPYQNRGANLWGTNPVAAPSMTSTTFRLGNNDAVNVSGNTYVAYLFATAAGVSKVGSYTGNGSTQTINCGFTGGARLVLIKRTDSTGDWYVYDTARGMTVLTDPYLLLNQTVAETATLGSVTTVSTGFAVNASILAAINTNAASYIFLALA